MNSEKQKAMVLNAVEAASTRWKSAFNSGDAAGCAAQYEKNAIMHANAWQYDEFYQVGKDYSLQAEVEVYDLSHADFRDLEKKSNTVLDCLAVGTNDVLIDFGVGTGTFAIHAARRCTKVYAVDVSEAMIDYAKAKAAKANLSNIVFCHGGFLTYKNENQAVDAIVSTLALHHLPDFWKGIALSRMSCMLKSSGQ